MKLKNINYEFDEMLQIHTVWIERVGGIYGEGKTLEDAVEDLIATIKGDIETSSKIMEMNKLMKEELEVILKDIETFRKVIPYK
jgi:hypothetical protein